MKPNRPPIRQRATAALAIAAIVSGMLGAPGVRAGTVTEIDEMAFLHDVSPAITVDHSTNCMPGATVGATVSTDAVAYRNDRIVVRTSASNGSVQTTINNTLHTMYTTGIDYAGPVERITFPTPPSGPAIVPVLSVTLLPRSGGLQHDILGLARHLRNDSAKIASPDYGMKFFGPYTHYFPYGYPQNTTALTTPRNNLTPNGAPVGAGLKIGTGVKVGVFDTGLFTADPINLPTTTQLSAADNDLVNLVNNGPKMVDFAPAGHGQGISGVLTTIVPGSTIQNVRINDRSGLATDVSAARAIASALRTLTIGNYPNLLINAFGTAACELNPAAAGTVLQPVGMEAIVEAIDRFDPSKPGGMLVVASAGNEATTRPNYPAAFPSVLSVGALDGTVDGDGIPWSSISKTAPVADFSNRGAWVDTYAPGVDLPTTHVNGYRFEYGADLILGIATVSGTSEAGPTVAGYVAEVMSETGATARGARDALIAGGKAPLPQCGTSAKVQGKAIVLSSLAATITAPSTPETITC